MSGRRAVLSVLSVLWIAAAGYSQEPSPNPTPAGNAVKNSGFEEGELLPAAWQKGQDVPGVEYLWTSGVAYEGQACVVLRKTENRYFPIAQWYQDIPHTGAEATLQVSARIKAQETTKAILDAEFRAASDTVGHEWIAYIGAKESSDPPVTHDWKKYTGEVKVPAGVTTIRIGLQIYGPGVVGFDNVTAVLKDSNGNVIPPVAAESKPDTSEPTTSAASGAPAGGEALPLVNPGFEEGEAQPSGWAQGAAVPGVEYLWSKDVAHSGKASLCLRKTAQRYFPIAQWTQSVPRSGDKPNLQVTASVKCDRVTKAILDAQFLDAAGEWSHSWVSYIGAKEAADPPVTHDWKPYAGVVPIPTGTKEIRIGLQIYGPGAVWFDDVQAAYLD
jgi:hypothetical protein